MLTTSQYIGLAAGIMLSPMPIIAMIVLCVTGRTKIGGTIFLLGWMISILAFMTFAVLFLGDLRQKDPENVSLFAIIFQLSAAALFFWIAWRNWSTRPKKGSKIPVPHWIESFSKMSNGKLFGMGAVMNFTNVKNLPIMITAGLAISKTAGNLSAGISGAIVFTTVASLSLIIPWLMSLLGGDATHRSIEHARIWLYKNNNIIMTFLFLYMGLNVLSAALINLGEHFG